MRLPEFFFNIIDRFSPMSEQDKIELRREAQLDYLAVKNNVFDETGAMKKKMSDMTIKEKIVKFSEYWPVRTALAILFIPACKFIQDWSEGGHDDDEETEIIEI